MPRNASPEAPDAADLRAALQALLDALAPLLLRERITPAMVSDSLRLAFVRAAMQGARMATGRVNHSRIATLTGLSRLEVRRLLATPQPVRAPPRRQLDRAARVVDGWRRDAVFHSAAGRPRVLPLRGPAPSFESLVRRFGGDVPAAAVRAELERAGAVKVVGDTIRLSRRRLPDSSDAAPANPLPALAPYLGAVLEAVAPGRATIEWAHQLRLPVDGEPDATLAADRARRTLAAAVAALRPATPTRSDARRRNPDHDLERDAIGITLIMTRPPVRRAEPVRRTEEEDS